jgi:tetratricopeptide (TPR) repeat protein
MQKYRHAIDEFRAAVEKRPDIPELYFNIGNAQRELKQFELAIKYYLKSLELNSAYVAAMQNLGIAYTQSEKYDLAHKYLKKAIQIAPNSSGVLNAIANVYQNQEDFRKAIEFYLKALRLERTKPDFHLNLAISLEGLKKNFLASQIYQRCIHLNPQYTPCINNYAYLCHRNGDTERAIDFYVRSLRISDQQFEAWNNIYFPLLTDKILNHRKDSEIENLLGAELKAKQPIEYQLLMHRLSNDTEQKVSFEKLKECIFSSQKYAVASKRKYKNKTVDLTAEKQITALLHFGRSGSGLLHSLIDGHPQIQTLPSVYFSEFFDRFSWQELLRDGPENVARKFVDMYPVFFDSRSKEAAFAQSMTQHKRFGEIEGLTKLGETADEYLWLDEKRFQMILQCFLDEETTITPRSVFQAVHAAFAEVAGFFNFDKNIFYHIHNPSPFALANYVSQFPNGKLVLIVRDPIQSCESWVIKVSDNREKIISRIVKMLSDVDNYVFQVVPSVGVRLEDVKRTPSETLSGLSRWMNIEYNEETMFEMTMMGKKWWGDPVSPDYKRDGMNPFGQISINRAKSSFFGDHDVRVLETLFYPFNVKFGYRNRDDEWFRDSLAYCEKNIGRLFEFEMRFASKMKISEQDLKLDGPYKYFRAKLIQKLRRLRENDDCHHNVITPLKS